MSKPGNCPWSIVELDPHCVCRDEHCDRVDIHPTHKVQKRSKKERPPAAGRELWKRSAPKALDRSIMKTTSKSFATHFGAMLQGVREDYGDVEERTMYRRVKRLVARGNLIKLDLGLSFAAYIRPKSRLIGDLGCIREQMYDQLETNRQYA